MSDPYLKDAGHLKRLRGALDDFEKALTKRWREEVTDQILARDREILTKVNCEGSPHEVPLWDAWSLGAVYHFTYRCAYVDWVDGGQKGELSSVTCPGETGTDHEIAVEDPEGGGKDKIPPKIDCGLGSILEQVANWAGGERDHVEHALPAFDHHNVHEIETAYLEFKKCGEALGLGMDSDAVGSMSERSLVGVVRDLTANRSEHKSWWEGWTGLAASSAKSNFFSSPAPTMNNQARICGALANLYNFRAAIIVEGRSGGLHSVEWATESLNEKETNTHDLTPMWKVVQGAGQVISISGGWTAVGGAVGASVTVVGFLGENLLDEVKTEDYAHGVEEVLTKLDKKIGKVKSDVEDQESDYRNEIADLRSDIWDIHSFNLELYDLTENNSSGQSGADKEGYTTDVEDLLGIGEACYLAGDLYEELPSTIAKTSDADSHLAGADGEPISADGSLRGVRDMLESFLKTTTGRYQLAGDQIKASAEAYVEVETDQKGTFNGMMTDWEQDGVGVYEEGDVFDPEDHVDGTDRSDEAGHPTDILSDPGEDDGGSYVTEKNR